MHRQLHALLRSEAENRVDLRRRVITGVCDGCDSPWRLDVVDASYPELQDLGSNETSVAIRMLRARTARPST